jgi:hypothetical protein
MRGGFGRMGRYGGFGDASSNSNATAPVPPGVNAGQPVYAPGQIPDYAGGNAISGKGIFFTYQTPNIASLANGASSGNQIIQFDNNSTFLWLRATVVADIAGAVQTNSTEVIPLCTIQITDTGNGMSFMNAPIPLAAIAGEARLPFILPVPQFIQPNASYSFNFTNYSAATTYANLRYQLIGFRMFQT